MAAAPPPQPEMPSRAMEEALPAASNTLVASSEQTAPVPFAGQLPLDTAQPVSGTNGADTALEEVYAKACNALPSLIFRSLVQQQTFPISLQGDVLTIGCVGEPNMTTLKKPDKFVHLQKAVDKAFGRPLRIEVVLEKKRPASSPAPVVQSQRPAQQTVASSPPPVTPVAQPLPPKPVEQPPSRSREELPSAQFDRNINPTPSAPARDESFSAPPMESDMPPMDMDEPPLLGEEGPASSRVMETTQATVAAATLSGDPELNEAKKHAVELMQGRILE